jgi:hypothetical protein
MSSTSLDLSRKFTSFSGADIRVVTNGQTIGTLQALSYAIQREKAPIYVMGHPDPKSFSRGKRGIAGTLITLMLDQHILKQNPFADSWFVADNDEMQAKPRDLKNALALDDLETVDSKQFDASNISANYQLTEAWYVDQLPPFDVVIIGANEYGNAASMRIYGIEILNEGSGFSIDDMVIDNQMTYVCRTIYPWQRLGSWDMSSGKWQPPGTSS